MMKLNSFVLVAVPQSLAVLLVFATTMVAARGQEHVTAAAQLETDEGGGAADGSAGHADIAKQLANPIANLISVPFTSDYLYGFGPEGDGWRYSMTLKPVIPFTLNEDWNLITRTILPFIHQEDIGGVPGFETGSQTGLGDTLFSAWFSPTQPTEGGWIWGVGPALSLPTGFDDLLGSGKWGAGPTAIALRQSGHWTYGALTNHVWSYAGDGDRSDVSGTFLQPFLSYTTDDAFTFVLQTESSYDWKAEQWTIPLFASVSKVVDIRGQKVQFQLGGSWYPEAPDQGPEWGARFGVTFVFPK